MSLAPREVSENPSDAWWKPIAIILPLYLITRATIFFAATAATDTQVYHQYGVAVRQGSLATLYKQYEVEYPQLAILFGAGVEWFADQLPSGVENLISARASTPPDVSTARFQVALGLVLFGFDTSLLLLIARQVRRESRQEQLWRLGLYVAGTSALGPIIYDRLDLVVGGVVLVALLAWESRFTVAAYSVLTFGVAFKLVPLLLFPVFTLAAAVQRGERFWPSITREVAIAALILALWPLLAYLFGGGERAFIYLKYHSDRRPELGSIYAAPLFLGNDVHVGYTFNSFTVLGPLPDMVAQVSPLIAVGAIGLAIAVFWRAVRRKDAPVPMSLVAGGCILVWLAFIITNKVGSPQYLLWLTPLVPFLPIQRNSDRQWAKAFVIAAILTTLNYPYLWFTIHGRPLPQEVFTWAGPNVLGFLLMISRWLAIVVVAVWLAVRLGMGDHQANTVKADSAPVGV